MIIFCGCAKDVADEIRSTGKIASHHKNSDTICCGALICSDAREYADLWFAGDMLTIEVDEWELQLLQECPLSPDDAEYQSWMDEANEYLVTAEVKITVIE